VVPLGGDALELDGNQLAVLAAALRVAAEDAALVG